MSASSKRSRARARACGQAVVGTMPTKSPAAHRPPPERASEPPAAPEPAPPESLAVSGRSTLVEGEGPLDA